jgi:hypothetical protein
LKLNEFTVLCTDSASKAEFNLDDLFPEKFPIQDTRGILVYIKQDLKAVEVNIDHDFKECVLVKTVLCTDLE